MRVLFLTSPEEDYLSDSLLLGFRALLGADVVDFPRRDILYRDCPEILHRQVRGHGFTLYSGLLTEIAVDRFNITNKLAESFFDLVVVSDIWRQFGYFVQWRPFLNPGNTILIDGADSAQVYLHAGAWWRRPYFWLLPRATDGFLYFKREWTEDSRFNIWHRVVPRALRRRLPYYSGMRRISYSIPEEKIVAAVPEKSKDFPQHIVDADVAKGVPGSSTAYAFSSEADYYADLRSSRFGVTTKRAGWDCLRHYEIAASGCVLCFKDLGRKPPECAPHGLVHGENCVAYADAAHLQMAIGGLSETQRRKLTTGAICWAQGQTTAASARRVIDEFTQRQVRRAVRHSPK